MPSTMRRRSGKRLTVTEVIAAGRNMLRAGTPTNRRGIQERMDAIDAVMACLNGSDYGTDFYAKLGREWSRLASTPSGGSSRSVPAATSWASRSVDEYARAEAAWQRDPARLELMARQPESWRLPPRPQRPRAGGDLSVRLDADTTPRATVNIAPSAYATITDACARAGGVETGGWLVGGIAFSWHANRTVTDALVAVKTSTRASVDLDEDQFAYVDERLRRDRDKGTGDERRAIGCWHSHPVGAGTPSPGDLACWARDLATIADHTASLTSLIIAQRDGRDSWARPVVSAWVTRRARSRFGARFVVEPGIVSVR